MRLGWAGLGWLAMVGVRRVSRVARVQWEVGQAAGCSGGFAVPPWGCQGTACKRSHRPSGAVGQA